MRGGIEQPVADLAILFGAVDLRGKQRGGINARQRALHGSFLPFDADRQQIVAVIEEADVDAASASVVTMPGERDPINS